MDQFAIKGSINYAEWTCGTADGKIEGQRYVKSSASSSLLNSTPKLLCIVGLCVLKVI